MPQTAKMEEPSAPQDLLAQQIERAHDSGRYLILSVRVEGDRLFCERLTHNFPLADLEVAKSLIEGELKKLAP